MINKAELCNKIVEIYPDMGSCGDTLTVVWDEDKDVWAVDFELKGQKIRHYLEDADAAACMIDKQCVGMSIEFGQFR